VKRLTYITSLFGLTVAFFAATAVAVVYSSNIAVILVLVGYYLGFRWLDGRRDRVAGPIGSPGATTSSNAAYAACPWCTKPIQWRPRFLPTRIAKCPHCGNSIKEAPGPRRLLLLALPLVLLIAARAIGNLYDVPRELVAIAALVAVVGMWGYYLTARLERRL
jgi:hypothetical protein